MWGFGLLKHWIPVNGKKKQNNKDFYSLRWSPSSCKTIPKTCHLHSSCILKFQAQPGLILLPRAGWRDGDEMDSITGWLMTLTTAAGSTASERTQKKHLEIPHAKEQVGGNRQQSPRLGRVFFFFAGWRMNWQRKRFDSLPIFGEQTSAAGSVQLGRTWRGVWRLMSPTWAKSPPLMEIVLLCCGQELPTTAAPTPLCGSRTGGRQFIILSSQGWRMTGLIGTRRGCLLSVSPL